MKKIIKIMDKILETCAFICIVAMITVVMIQVYSRFALPRAPHWTEEAARFLFIYTVSFAGGLAIREKAFVSVDVFTSLLPEKYFKVLEIFLYSIIIGFMGVIVKYAQVFMKIGSIQKSPSLLVPMNIPFTSMLIVAIFMGIYSFLQIVENIKDLKGRGES